MILSAEGFVIWSASGTCDLASKPYYRFDKNTLNIVKKLINHSYKNQVINKSLK